MRTRKIDWPSILQKDEQIIWQGQPKGDFHISLLENNKMYHDVLSGPTNKVIVTFVIIGHLAILIYKSGYPILASVWILVALGVLLYLDFLRYLEAKHTFYMASNRAIYIGEVSRKEQVIKKLNYENIHSIKGVEFADKPGEVYFLTSQEGLTTRDFATGEKRHYPTFEDIENASEVQKTIETYWRKIPCNQIFSNQFTIKEPENKVAVILFTPIFEVPKSIKIDGREYMNGINMKNSKEFYGFLIFFEIVLFGCFLMLFHPKVRSLDSDLFAKIIMVTLFISIVFAIIYLRI